jgi:formylglycine-generating enzyme required for sulfatase activity
MRFVYVPEGRFQMGSIRLSAAEKPVHWVRLSAFWIGEVPVTNRQYAQFMAATSWQEPPRWRDERFSDPEQPVVSVSWYDAQAYCRWLCTAAGVAAALPSEAQWEYAARGAEGRRYPWGNKLPDATRACFRDMGPQATSRVGSFPDGRGPFGALDHLGNVWEWCDDVWDKQAYQRPPDSLDPIHSDGKNPDHRVVRGGSWGSRVDTMDPAFREWFRADQRNVGNGFRVVIPAKQVHV